MTFAPRIHPVPTPERALLDTQPLGLAQTQVWDGSPTARIQVDLRRGGLGDAVLTLAVARAALRSGRIGGARLHIRAALAPLLFPEDEWVTDEPGPDLPLLPALHVLVRHRYTHPDHPLTLLAARCLNLDPEALRGPVITTQATPPGPWLVQLDEPPQSAVPSPWNQFKHIKSSTELMRRVASMLAKQRDVALIGHGDKPVDGVVDLRQLDLPGLAAAISASPMLICCDSGPQHLAAVLGTPTLALYGPSDPRLHACAETIVPLQGPCPVGPCGAGSSYGMPLQSGPILPGHGALAALPFPCPAATGACLRDLDPKRVVAAAERAYQQLRGPSSLE